MIKEFCAENFTNIPAAIKAGAKRIELCDNLSCGGTTVSTGVMEETILYCHEHQTSVMTLIRPRGGDFIYNDTEVKMMLTDLLEAQKLGADGVVIGALTKDHWLDEDTLLRLIEAANGLQVTFHMAFDMIPKERQKAAIDWLAEQGVDRILTHGGASDTPFEENLDYLKSLVDYAKERITILPGGGITYQNAEAVAKKLGISEVHGTKIVKL